MTASPVLHRERSHHGVRSLTMQRGDLTAERPFGYYGLNLELRIGLPAQLWPSTFPDMSVNTEAHLSKPLSRSVGRAIALGDCTKPITAVYIRAGGCRNWERDCGQAFGPIRPDATQRVTRPSGRHRSGHVSASRVQGALAHLRRDCRSGLSRLCLIERASHGFPYWVVEIPDAKRPIDCPMKHRLEICLSGPT